VPVRVKGEESLTQESVKRLCEKDKLLSGVYGMSAASFFLDTLATGVSCGDKKGTLDDLLDAIESEVKKLGA
jgi:hypothetical protein